MSDRSKLAAGLAALNALAAPISYYSAGYEEARARFREAANVLVSSTPGALTWADPVPSRTETDLTVDGMYLPPLGRPKRLLVVTSGVHGMEAFVGSAVQLMLLREAGPQFDRRETGYMFVHVLNPYGFKRQRRATENNVNLNRNFGLDQSLYSTANPGYAALRDALEPAGPAGSPWLSLAQVAWQLGGRVAMGNATLALLGQSIGQGQFEYAQGLEYGGAGPEPQTRDFLRRLQEIAKPFEQIVLTDLHTGLGDRYRLHLMPGDADRSVDAALFAELFTPSEDIDAYAFTPNDSDGFYRTYGDLNNVIPQLLSPEQRAVAVTLEYGTVGNGGFAKLETIARVIQENRGFHFGYASASAEAASRSRFADLFFPSEEKWRVNAIETARATYTKMLMRMRAADDPK